MSAAAPRPADRPAWPWTDVARPVPCMVAFALTAFAFPPGQCPPYSDEARWVRRWSVGGRSALQDLCTRLGRRPADLSINDRPETGDVEILGPIGRHQVVLALVAHGLTAAECQTALHELQKVSR